MEITANAVKELREKTGAGMMDCKKALAETMGDFDKAVVWLREKGVAQVAKRSGRSADQGIIGSYVQSGKVGVLVEVNCETDFVAKTDDFQNLVKELATQVAEEKNEKAVLLDLPYKNDPKKTVGQRVTEVAAKVGENLVVRRSVRLQLGAADQGVIGSYVHSGKVGVLVEIHSKTESAAKNEDFVNLAKELAMQVAASAPKYVSREEVPAAEIEQEKAIYLAEAKQSGKPEAVQQKIAEGKIESYYKQVCLVDQPYIREPKKSVKQYVAEVAAKVGETVVVRRFSRLQLGE